MSTKTKKMKKRTTRKTIHKSAAVSATQPFAAHLHELRRRLYYIAISLVLWGTVIYGVQQQVVRVLLRPARGEHFIYTTPGGGIDFLFRVCLYGALVLSLPVIVYNALRFMEPLVRHGSQRFIFIGSLVSGLLALIGVIFGYYVGLPAALHFLLHQFTTAQIQPLVTIQSYLRFVIVYMVGSAMLFQLPLILLFINRIKPLRPQRLLHYERWVILIAFILAGLMNPTPNIFSQLLVAGPFILMYQIGILIIALINRPKRPAHVRQLMEQDEIVRAQRQSLASAQTRSRPTVPAARLAGQPILKREVSYQPQPQHFMDFIPSSTPPVAPGSGI